jgi:hypothetical protein
LVDLAVSAADQVVEVGLQFILQTFLTMEGLKTGKISSGLTVETRQANEL